ncbi:hypothetical protein FF38_02907 [Lucilia cuprina]|uniref:Uncharacterized protein n=1 Tax=Lucilia cuprina TaxID=7375 RepID=A0A0L0CHP0_LUCCU|nr:hypothetical protein FF38_02907 [Lucilia cuprina]
MNTLKLEMITFAFTFPWTVAATPVAARRLTPCIGLIIFFTKSCLMIDCDARVYSKNFPLTIDVPTKNMEIVGPSDVGASSCPSVIARFSLKVTFVMVDDFPAGCFLVVKPIWYVFLVLYSFARYDRFYRSYNVWFWHNFVSPTTSTFRTLHILGFEIIFAVSCTSAKETVSANDVFGVAQTACFISGSRMPFTNASILKCIKMGGVLLDKYAVTSARFPMQSLVVSHWPSALYHAIPFELLKHFLLRPISAL